MLRSLTIISLVAATALAQSSANIPTGISQGCTDFLTELNTNSTIAACVSSLTGATSGYLPGSAATTSPSAAQISSTLGNLCSTSVTDSCPQSLIRAKIADFYSACTPELTSTHNTDVIATYDKLYTLLPFRTAACSKDDSGNYCATQAKLPASAPPAAQIQQVLSTSSLAPNTTTYSTWNIAFFFLQASLPSTDLCTVCTRNIMTAYMNFETSVSYAPGLSASVLLAGQSDLYQGCQNTCGSTFLSNAGVQAAGGLSGDTIHNGAIQTTVGASQGFIGAGMGILAVIAASVF